MNLFLAKAKQWAKALKRDVHAIWLAARDPQTPWFVKMLAIAVAAYALSPIDLIPDFIPVLGYLDDLIILPLGIMLVVRLIPPDLMAKHREAASQASKAPVSRAAAVLFVAVWVLSAALLVWVLR